MNSVQARNSALIIFGKIHFLLTSENLFFMKYNVTELQVCMDFMFSLCQKCTWPHSVVPTCWLTDFRSVTSRIPDSKNSRLPRVSDSAPSLWSLLKLLNLASVLRSLPGASNFYVRRFRLCHKCTWPHYWGLLINLTLSRWLRVSDSEWVTPSLWLPVCDSQSVTSSLWLTVVDSQSETHSQWLLIIVVPVCWLSLI